MMNAAQLHDYMQAIYGPTTAQDWAAFSLGGVSQYNDRGVNWGETRYGKNIVEIEKIACNQPKPMSC